MKKIFLPFFSLLILPFSVSAQTFIDVPETVPHYEAVEWAAEEGIVQGFDNREFRPKQEVTRAEFLKIVIDSHNEYNSSHFSRQFEEEELQNCFSDIQNEWFSKYVCASKEYEFIGGYNDGNFYPDRSINYAESAKIISEVFSLDFIQGEQWFSGYIETFDRKEINKDNSITADKNITRSEMVQFMYALKEENKVQSYCAVPTMVALPQGCSWKSSGISWSGWGQYACITTDYEKICTEEEVNQGGIDEEIKKV